MLESEYKVLALKWNGNNSQYTLAIHISSHGSVQNDMMRAEDHIGYQPPNEYTQVQCLIKSIESTDIRIVSDLTTILGDTVKRGNFEQATDFVLLAAPMSKNDTPDN